jgi:hypothetical protein
LGRGKKLNIITAYCVIEQKVTPSNSMSTNSQQHHLLILRGINDAKPRVQFIMDFNEQFGAICNNSNNMTILMINTNENMNSPENNGILINAFEEFHDNVGEFPTHLNGSKCIDYMLVTRNVMPFISRIGYTKFHELYNTDHRGIYCDLNNSIFDSNTTPINSPRKRQQHKYRRQ